MRTDALALQQVHAPLSPDVLDLLRAAAISLGVSVEIWNAPGRCTERLGLAPGCAACERGQPRIFDRCRKRRSYLTRRDVPVPLELAERCPLKLRLARLGPPPGHAGPTVFAFGYVASPDSGTAADAPLHAFLRDLQALIQIAPGTDAGADAGPAEGEDAALQLLHAISPRLSPDLDALSLPLLAEWRRVFNARWAFVWLRDAGLWGMSSAGRPDPPLERELQRRAPALARRLAEAFERSGKPDGAERLGPEHPISRALGGPTQCVAMSIADGEARGIIAGLRAAESAPPASAEMRLLQSLAGKLALSMSHAALRATVEVFLTRTLAALVSAMDARASETQGHSQRVHTVAMLLGNQLRLGRPDLEALHWAALLHDVGKLGSAGSGAPSETAPPSDHAESGWQMLQGIHELERAALGVRHHHEHWDGSGGPAGLERTEIPLVARVVAVADAFDVQHARAGRPGCSLVEAVEAVEAGSGLLFDPEVVLALRALLPLVEAHPWVLLAAPILHAVPSP